MKTYITNLFVCVTFFCFGIAFANAQSFCLKMSEVSNDGKELIVKVEMQSIEEFNLADGNLQFAYDGSALGTPKFVSSDLAPPVYYIPTVTTPAPETGSINIVLPFPGTGVKVENSPDWLEIIQISFPVIDRSNIGPISWQYNGGTTQTVLFADGPKFPIQIFADDKCLTGYKPLSE